MVLLLLQAIQYMILTSTRLYSVQAVAIFLGPILLPRLLGYYRSLRTSYSTSRPQPIKPLTASTRISLAILFISSVVALTSTLPLFQPGNVFSLTSSRLLTNTNVLFARLAQLRPLTASEETLKSIFENGKLDARLFYLQYGPQTLLDNTFSTPDSLDAERAYFFYAIPEILRPHLWHILSIAIATSATLTSLPLPFITSSISPTNPSNPFFHRSAASTRTASSWRTLAVLFGTLLAAAELYLVYSFDRKSNTKSVRVNDLIPFHWRICLYRGLAISFFDALLGLTIYLSTTNRFIWSLSPALTPSQRSLDHSLQLEDLLTKLRGLGVVSNTVVRDASMRNRKEDYWIREGEVMRDVMEQTAVLAAQRGALNRLDLNRIEDEAKTYAETIWSLPPTGLGTAA